MVCPKIASLEVVELGLGYGHSDFFHCIHAASLGIRRNAPFLGHYIDLQELEQTEHFIPEIRLLTISQSKPDTPRSLISCSHPLPIFLGFRQIFLKVLFKIWNILTNCEWDLLPLENHILNKQDVFKRWLITLSSYLTTAAILSFSSSRRDLSWVWSVSFQTFCYVLTSIETVVFGVIHRVVGSWVVFWFGCFTPCGEHTGSSFLVDTGTRFSGGDNEIQNCSTLGYGPILLPNYSAKWF